VSTSATAPNDVHDEPSSRTFTTQGLTLRYLDWGNLDAPALVLLHGVRDHARSWDWTARTLRAHFRVLALDLRGHGDSDWSPDGAYLAGLQMLDVADFLDTLPGDRVSLVGHSFGGNLAARYAALFPDRVHKLVLVDGMGPSLETQRAWETQGPVARSRQWVEDRRKTQARQPKLMSSIDEATARMAAANRHLSMEQASHLARHGVRRHGDGYVWKFDPRIGSFLPEDFAIDLAHFWRAIRARTLLCWGTESWTGNPESDGRAQQLRDQRTVVFRDAGHWLHHDQLDHFSQTLQEFLHD